MHLATDCRYGYLQGKLLNPVGYPTDKSIWTDTFGGTMGRMFKREAGNWVLYRDLPNVMEVDFHFREEETLGAYWMNMEDVERRTIEALKRAREEGKQYVLFTHGHSTSRIGMTTARSQVRKVMRGKAATPYIVRSESIQHYSVFVAAIKPKKQ
ncbi:MAG: hypothetical protein JSR83_23245 [Proteobacteria bacterium]|nr:hypothetical protein [Pseudomonadota bacterium]